MHIDHNVPQRRIFSFKETLKAQTCFNSSWSGGIGAGAFVFVWGGTYGRGAVCAKGSYSIPAGDS